MNVKTHTNKVHAARQDRSNRPVPVCMSRTQIMNLHYAIPTEEVIDCVKCQNKMDRIAKDQATRDARKG